MRRIDPSLLKKIQKQNQTIYKGANPKMSIQVSRAKTTVMDSTYWTIETIRTKEGIGDLSVVARRQRAYGSPDRLYNIYVDNGIVKTAIREYPDYEELKWQHQFEVGNGTAVAIAFNGYWEYYRETWRMITDENPSLFWIDNSAALYTQEWDNTETKQLLATDTIKVKAIRAWRNINIPEVDQGLVVGYIKTDGVYYRNYAYQEDGKLLWEPERQVYAGIATNLNLFITNDYRMGFAIEDDAGKIHLYITKRAWAGMGIGREVFYARPDMDINFIPIRYRSRYSFDTFKLKPKLDLSYLYASSYNEIIHAENVDDGEGNFGKKVFVRTKHQMFYSSASEFSLKDENSTAYNVVSMEEISTTEFIVEFLDFNNATGDLNLSFVRNTARNEAGYEFDNMEVTFSPTGLIPTAIPVPEVEAIWNE